MSDVHVFNAGPCLLPQQAIDNSIEALKNFKNTGISVLSVSHRSKEWGEVMDEVRANWKELLHIPDTHEAGSVPRRRREAPVPVCCHELP